MKNLSAPFIERPVMTTLVMATVLFFGIISYKALPVSDLPSVEYPTLQISATYPGADPETMSNRVSYPLERQFTGIQGIKSISANSITGSTTIVLQFQLDHSIDAAATDTLAAINQALPNLPADLPSNPTYKKVNPTQSPIIYFAISSDTLTRGKLYDYGYSLIAQRLSMVNGVGSIVNYGSPYAVRVQVNPDSLFAKEVGIEQVASTISRGNPELPTGTLYGPDTEYTITVDGQIEQAEGYSSLIVRSENGELVRISDLGRAIDSLQNDKYSLVHQTKEKSLPSVIIGVQKQPKANAVAVIAEIKALLKDLEKELPASVDVITLFDESRYIFESVDDVMLTLYVAFTLVVLVVLFYLGKIIDTIIPILVLPLTIVGTFAMMYVLDYNIDILSLMAITLSIGFLVDDAIVVLENIVRHAEEGGNAYKAAMEGSKQISFTILSMTLCLASVFIPLIFMGGVVGRIFREFGGTIITAVLISGCISLTLTPLLCSRLIKANKEGKKNWIERVSTKINTGMLNIYSRGLEVVFRHKLTTLLIGIGSVIVTAYLFVIVPKDFLPPDDLGFVQGFTEAGDGTSPYKTIEYQKQINDMLLKDANVSNLTSVAGLPNDNSGLFFIDLKPYKFRKPMPQVVGELSQKLRQIPGVNAYIKPYPLIDLSVGTSASQGSYQYVLQSVDSDDLYPSAQKMISAMRTIPGISQVTSDMHIAQPQVKFSIDRDRAYDLNISAFAIEQALAYAYAGGRVTQINAEANQYWVILETLPNAYKDPSVLSKIYVSSINNSPVPNVEKDLHSTQRSFKSHQSNGTQIPLSLVTKYEETTGPLAINHFDILPSVTITFDLDGIPLSTALERIDSAAKDNIPPNVFGNVQGTANIFQAAFGELSLLFIVSLFVIYVILGILYENFIHPITVMSVLPPAALGGLLTLVIFDLPLSLYAFVGIMMLLGIVLKNGVMLVDFANESIIKEGHSIEEAIHFACHKRFRPIIMTTFSALMGAVPIALGVGGLTALSRMPLGMVIVGGLIFSQVITLFLTPVVFIYLEKLRESTSRFIPKTIKHFD